MTTETLQQFKFDHLELWFVLASDDIDNDNEYFMFGCMFVKQLTVLLLVQR